MENSHFVLVIFPAQGHINPAVQLADRLIRIGAHVTLVTSSIAKLKISETSLPNGLSCIMFSDGYNNELGLEDNVAEIKRRGTEAVSDLIETQAKEGKPVTCLVITILMHWVAEVARLHSLPSAFLWPQAVMVFDLLYYYFNEYNHVFSKCSSPSFVVELPCLPQLTSRDLPSVLLPWTAQSFLLSGFKEHMAILSEENKPIVLVNTFDALETQALKAVDKFNLFGVGQLISLAFLDDTVPNDKLQLSKNYIDYLNSKPYASVVYISFGSHCILSSQQMEEIAKGLKNSGHPFLWVIREDQDTKINDEKKEHDFPFREELEQRGMIVPWCSQIEVLSHESLGCFVTHCGWNSTIESLVVGVPTVAFPQSVDQGTNAKLIEDVWETGVRVVANEEGIVTNDEIEKCLDLVMRSEDKAVEIRSNAKKWKELAREAVKDGGSSDNNLKSLVAEVVRK